VSFQSAEEIAMEDFPGAYGPAGDKREVLSVGGKPAGSSLQHEELITGIDIPETTCFVPRIGEQDWLRRQEMDIDNLGLMASKCCDFLSERHVPDGADMIRIADGQLAAIPAPIDRVDQIGIL
jgi:hypothetical protein